jgi:hypothetical protein
MTITKNHIMLYELFKNNINIIETSIYNIYDFLILLYLNDK